MLKEAQNEVALEGILLSKDIKSFVSKDGRDFLKGTIVIRVPMEEGIVSDVPVEVFSGRITSKGGVNPSYTSIAEVNDKFKSIEEVGEDEATRVIVSGCSIGMREYAKVNGSEAKIVSFPQVKGSFFKEVKKSDFKPTATFRIVGIVANTVEQTNENTDETSTILNLIVPNFRGEVDIIPFKAGNDKVTNIITSWDKCDTVSFGGYLNFTTEETVKEIENDFGPSEVKTYTRHVSEFIINRGSSTPLEGMYEMEEVDAALGNRKAKLETMKEEALNRANTTAPAAAPTSTKPTGFSNLGF